MADWTPELLEEARRLWTDGWSASLIAEKLGLTKGQVIGRVHRLHWGSRPTVHERPNSLTERLKAIKIVKGKARTHAAPKPKPPPPPPVALRTVPIEHLVVPAEGKRTLLDLRPGDCRWPMNEPPRGGLYLFCAERQFNGFAYCEAHCRIAFSGKGTARQASAAPWAPKPVNF